MIYTNRPDGIRQCRNSAVKLVARSTAVLKEVGSSTLEDETLSSDNFLHLVATANRDLPSASLSTALVVEPLARVRYLSIVDFETCLLAVEKSSVE